MTAGASWKPRFRIGPESALLEDADFYEGRAAFGAHGRVARESSLPYLMFRGYRRVRCAAAAYNTSARGSGAAYDGGAVAAT